MLQYFSGTQYARFDIRVCKIDHSVRAVNFDTSPAEKIYK